jgi:hypothetical protein
MHQQAPWDKADSVSYLSTSVKQNEAWLVPGWESALGFISMSSLLLTPSVSTLCVPDGTQIIPQIEGMLNKAYERSEK